MKKRSTFFALVLIAALVLGLFAACGSGSQETAKKDDETYAQQKTETESEEAPPRETVPTDETEPDETEPEDLHWSYFLEVDTANDACYSDDGTLLVSVSCECPVLMLACDGDADSIPPAAMQNVCDSFNETMREVCFFGAEDMAEQAEEDYEIDSEYFYAYEYSIAVTDSRIEGDLVEVTLQTYSYWGGAHGGSSIAGYHFDLLEGEFFTISDLTDDPAEFAGAIAEEIIAQIDASGEADFYFPDYKDTIRAYGEYHCLFGSDSMTVIFGEYDIAPYAEGIKMFEIPYDFVSSFLNERGARLLLAE